MSGRGTPDRIERRILAIMASDVVGYSRAMEADEAGTIRRVTEWQSEVLLPAIGRHRGRLVKLIGDGALAVFDSVVDAVTCAAEVQTETRSRGAGQPQPLLLRIGVNLGDVALVDGDIYGDGVNVAARLEALAPPGGLLISRAVRDQIRDKLPFPFEDEGEHRVKNLSRPIRAFLLHPEVIAALPEPDLVAGSLRTGRRRLLTFLALLVAALVLATGAWVGGRLLRPGVVDGPAPLSIAVLPFSGGSDDPEHAVLADAITENLITDLSRISGAFVIASSTSFTFFTSLSSA